MPLFYQRNFIRLGNQSQQHGHVVYTHAQYQPKPNVDAIPIVFKKNKQDNPLLSQLEVGFGELARLFLAPSLTPPQVLVKDNKNKTVGVACEHLSYTIARRELLPNSFYKFQTEGQSGQPQLVQTDVCDTDDVPFHFLKEFRPGFFSVLKRAAEKGKIRLDMESLAQVLTGSYTLEEDDLHKGNLGFYVVKKDNKPHVVFFKIDHDLMLADSVMSHGHSRWLNWLNGTVAFDITKRDLIDFPRLTDSQNYYWPTVKRPFLGVGSKAFTSDEEVDAFAALSSSVEFRYFKWQSFYKHVLIPPPLIQKILGRHLDSNDPNDRAQTALIVQSVVARQAKLRAVLFSTQEFRNFVRTMTAKDHQALIANIVDSAEPDKAQSLAKEIQASMSHHQVLCQPSGGFVEDDTPLHAAIRLQDYRYHDTWQAFSQYVDQKNKQGKTPLDVAVGMANLPPKKAGDIRCDALCTMKHLLREGAKKTDDYQQFSRNAPMHLNNYLFRSGYPTRARSKMNEVQLIRLLRHLGEDYRYSLKMQKELAVICVQQFIKQHLNNPGLAQMFYKFKSSLNGTSTTSPAPELQFIRQLRSQLWIVRMIRGLLGGTATKVQLNGLIDKELNRLPSPTVSCCSFFSRKKPELKETQDVPVRGLTHR